MSKESFKQFVHNHPELLAKVNSQEMTFQKYYEIYDLYGEDEKVWEPYLKGTTVADSSFQKSKEDIVKMIKSLDLESIQKGITGLQKAIGIVQDLGLGSKKETKTYEPRPMYQYFDD